MKEPKFHYESKVVVKNLNSIKAKHLEGFIGKQGKIISWIRINDETIKYKLKFDNDQQHYFYEDEIYEISN